MTDTEHYVWMQSKCFIINMRFYAGLIIQLANLV